MARDSTGTHVLAFEWMKKEKVCVWLVAGDNLILFNRTEEDHTKTWIGESKETEVSHSIPQGKVKAAHGWTLRFTSCGGDGKRLEKSQKLDHEGFHANLGSSIFIFWVTAATHLVLSRETNKLELDWNWFFSLVLVAEGGREI